MKIKASVSPGTLKFCKDEMYLMINRIDYYKNTDLVNDIDIMSRLALARSLLEQVYNLIYE